MTLERHRSKLIPDIDFSAEGRLFVTDRHGSFPIRHRESKKGKEKVEDISWRRDGSAKHKGERESHEMHETRDNWEYDPHYRIFDDLSSYRSFDPKRDSKRKYKPKQISNYERAMRDITGTISSKSSNSSLGRRLKRSRSYRPSSEGEGRFGTTHSTGSTDSISRFKRGQTPRMSPEMRQSVRRNKKRYRSLDVNELRKMNRKEVNNNFLDEYARKKKGAMNGNVPLDEDLDFPFRERTLSEEKLPRVLFIMIGILLILCGIVRLLLSRWHEYFHPLWTGALLLLTGLIAICHKQHYLEKCQNLSYILFSALSAIATMVATALILHVLVPLTRHVAMDTEHSVLLNKVDFAYWKDPLVDASMSLRTMIYMSLVLDYVTLACCLLGYYSLSAMLICIDNHMDAVTHTTGQCDHKGTPRFFNPLEQMSLTQASIFMGLVVIAVQTPDTNHYLSPLWGPLCMFMAAFASVFYGKRPDLSGLGWMSTGMQLFSMMTCGVATVLMTLGLVQAITELGADDSDYKEAELIVSACAQVLFILLMIINIVFSVGVVFRHFRLMCCADCFDYPDGYDEYEKKEPYYDMRL